MLKVQEILAKFGSLINSRGGDVYNKGITSTFGPNPYSSSGRSHLNKDISIYLNTPEFHEGVITRTQMSAGGSPQSLNTLRQPRQAREQNNAGSQASSHMRESSSSGLTKNKMIYNSKDSSEFLIGFTFAN